jgi:hypothetical protein
MDDDERAALLKRINRQGATVGASVPETITIGDEEIELAEFLIETRKLERIPPEIESTITTVKRTLRDERSHRADRLESAPIDRDTAETIADEIVGIDRALNALETIRHPDYGDLSRAQFIQDNKRWVDFLDQIA